MQVLVYGLSHLGCVTAASLAEHFTTVGYDEDAEAMSELRAGRSPILEPGLAELLRAGLSAGTLTFAEDLATGAQNADVVWVTFDTPIRDDDTADVEFISRRAASLFPHLSDGTVLLISSQVPVGFTAQTEAAFRSTCPGVQVSFAYWPENLRVGKALETFRHPDRIVLGIRSQSDTSRLKSLAVPFCERIEWVSVESAEMIKHSLNAFLATSVSFINEIAVLCEQVGADAREVERGLKSDSRIGQSAYLSPGGAFAGGTLARDLTFLTSTGGRVLAPTHLLTAVSISNNHHKAWPQQKLKQLLGDLSSATVTVLGLTYKPSTDTLRGSGAVELCRWLADQGAHVRAYDPAVSQLPPALNEHIRLCASAREAIQGVDALVLATEWPVFRELSAKHVVAGMRTPVVLDPNRFLMSSLGSDSRVRYVTVGRPKNAL